MPETAHDQRRARRQRQRRRDEQTQNSTARAPGRQAHAVEHIVFEEDELVVGRQPDMVFTAEELLRPELEQLQGRIDGSLEAYVDYLNRVVGRFPGRLVSDLAGAQPPSIERWDYAARHAAWAREALDQADYPRAQRHLARGDEHLRDAEGRWRAYRARAEEVAASAVGDLEVVQELAADVLVNLLSGGSSIPASVGYALLVSVGSSAATEAAEALAGVDADIDLRRFLSDLVQAGGGQLIEGVVAKHVVRRLLDAVPLRHSEEVYRALNEILELGGHAPIPRERAQHVILRRAAELFGLVAPEALGAAFCAAARQVAATEQDVDVLAALLRELAVGVAGERIASWLKTIARS